MAQVRPSAYVDLLVGRAGPARRKKTRAPAVPRVDQLQDRFGRLALTAEEAPARAACCSGAPTPGAARRIAAAAFAAATADAGTAERPDGALVQHLRRRRAATRTSRHRRSASCSRCRRCRRPTAATAAAAAAAADCARGGLRRHADAAAAARGAAQYRDVALSSTPTCTSRSSTTRRRATSSRATRPSAHHEHRRPPHGRAGARRRPATTAGGGGSAAGRRRRSSSLVNAEKPLPPAAVLARRGAAGLHQTSQTRAASGRAGGQRLALEVHQHGTERARDEDAQHTSAGRQARGLKAYAQTPSGAAWLHTCQSTFHRRCSGSRAVVGR